MPATAFDTAVVPAGLAVVVLGLLASLTWGVADFGGGVTSRRAPLLGVLLATQIVGLGLALVFAAIRSEPPVSGTFAWGDLEVGAGAGLLGALGLSGLYRGLAVGRMGVVAPVGGVLAALIPVLGGLILQGWPSALVMSGIGLAIGSVVLVSRAEDETSDRPSGLAWGLFAGIGMGAFSLLISRVSPGLIFGPLVVVRVVELAAFVAAVVVARAAWRVPRHLWPVVAGVGVLDVLGNAFYLGSTQSGPLAIAAVLSSLYPVVTVILATVVLRERVTRTHAVGIAAAAVAIAMIAGGSAG